MKKIYQKPETILIHATIEQHILAGSPNQKTDNFQHIGQETLGNGDINQKKEEGNMGYTDGTGGFEQGTKPNYWDI